MTDSARVVLVTGASSGIGRAAALQAAADGDSVVVVARGEGPLLAVADECRRSGASEVLVRPADVGDDESVREVVAGVVADLGRIDVVIHSAGVVAYGRTEEIPAEVFDAVLRTNVLGSVNVARHVVPVLRGQQRGSLVLVGSVIGHIGVPGMTPYVVSKWGVRALTRQLQLENRDLPGVHIGYLSPGGVDTPIYRQAANYSGYVGRPPPPVASPDRVARAALRMSRTTRARRQVGLANDLMRFGFSALPGVFDLMVGPLFTVAGKDRTDPTAPTTGNVLASSPERNRLHGDQGNAVVGVGRNLVRLWQARTS